MIASLAIVAGVALGQQYTVEENNPAADFQYLQDALDSVEDGATLLLYGTHSTDLYGSHSSVISRSVTLVGDPNATILKRDVSVGGYPALLVDAVGAEVALAHLEIVCDGAYDTRADIGLLVQNVARFSMDQCVVSGQSYRSLYDFPQPGAAGAFFNAPGSVAFVTSCYFYGGKGQEVNYCGPTCEWEYYGAPGGVGAGVATGEVVFKDCSFTGGDGGNLRMDFAPDGDTRYLPSGDGGDGLSATNSYYTHCYFHGGNGGRIYDPITNYEYPDNGYITHGLLGTGLSGTTILLPDTLSLWEWSFFIGSDIVLEGSDLAPQSPVILFVAADALPPVLTALGTWFLAPPLFPVRLSTDANGYFKVMARIPLDYAFVGLQLFFQAFDGVALTNPESGVVGA